ncbi:MAG: ATP-dependent protease, partial [Lentisphaeria bacterium]|nr:ATP-dependent protease [Lentisphaeria bacterium]NQZ69245.1 ATP-dependent protease [Lentisphaeria bacterium]
MSDKKDKDQDKEKGNKEFEEFQKQLQSIFSNFNPQTTHINIEHMSMDEEPEEEEEIPEEFEEVTNEEMLDSIRQFTLKPREVRDYLDRYVIKQNEAKKVLSVAICDHYNHVRLCLED